MYTAGNIPLIPILIPAPKPIKIVFEGQWQLEHSTDPEMEFTTELPADFFNQVFGRYGIIEDTDEDVYEDYLKKYTIE